MKQKVHVEKWETDTTRHEHKTIFGTKESDRVILRRTFSEDFVFSITILVGVFIAIDCFQQVRWSGETGTHDDLNIEYGRIECNRLLERKNPIMKEE